MLIKETYFYSTLTIPTRFETKASATIGVTEDGSAVVFTYPTLRTSNMDKAELVCFLFMLSLGSIFVVCELYFMASNARQCCQI